MSLCPHRHEFSSSTILKLLAMEKANIQKTVSLSKSLHSAGEFYAWMIRNKAVPAVAAVYPGGDAVWQDDPASIHRTRAALDACSSFAERIPHESQAAKCSDIWPIEQVGLHQC